ncbi:hypothetical protein BC830DRAFT_1085322 [Chytriomyces sp. MP71]|nr:hypothetical protein BC830DRAFT_1085322 [Chytriomyces sp. MP71]
MAAVASHPVNFGMVAGLPRGFLAQCALIFEKSGGKYLSPLATMTVAAEHLVMSFSAPSHLMQESPELDFARLLRDRFDGRQCHCRNHSHAANKLSATVLEAIMQRQIDNQWIRTHSFGNLPRCVPAHIPPQLTARIRSRKNGVLMQGLHCHEFDLEGAARFIQTNSIAGSTVDPQGPLMVTVEHVAGQETGDLGF